MKWRDDAVSPGVGEVAGDVVTFIDDVRITCFLKGKLPRCEAAVRRENSVSWYAGCAQKVQAAISDERRSVDRNCLQGGREIDLEAGIAGKVG